MCSQWLSYFVTTQAEGELVHCKVRLARASDLKENCPWGVHSTIHISCAINICQSVCYRCRIENHNHFLRICKKSSGKDEKINNH